MQLLKSPSKVTDEELDAKLELSRQMKREALGEMGIKPTRDSIRDIESQLEEAKAERDAKLRGRKIASEMGPEDPTLGESGTEDFVAPGYDETEMRLKALKKLMR